MTVPFAINILFNASNLLEIKKKKNFHYFLLNRMMDCKYELILFLIHVTCDVLLKAFESPESVEVWTELWDIKISAIIVFNLWVNFTLLASMHREYSNNLTYRFIINWCN